MNDFLDTFPPEANSHIVEAMANTLIRWARQQEVLRMVVRHNHSTEFEVLYSCPEAIL